MHIWQIWQHKKYITRPTKKKLMISVSEWLAKSSQTRNSWEPSISTRDLILLDVVWHVMMRSTNIFYHRETLRFRRNMKIMKKPYMLISFIFMNSSEWSLHANPEISNFSCYALPRHIAHWTVGDATGKWDFCGLSLSQDMRIKAVAQWVWTKYETKSKNSSKSLFQIVV